MNLQMFNAVGKWAAKVNRDKKPRIKAYSVDYLIWIGADKDGFRGLMDE